MRSDPHDRLRDPTVFARRGNVEGKICAYCKALKQHDNDDISSLCSALHLLGVGGLIRKDTPKTRATASRQACLPDVVGTSI